MCRIPARPGADHAYDLEYDPHVDREGKETRWGCANDHGWPDIDQVAHISALADRHGGTYDHAGKLVLSPLGQQLVGSGPLPQTGSQSSLLPLPQGAGPIKPMAPPGAHYVTSAAGGRAIVIPASAGGKAISPARAAVCARHDAWIELKIAEGYSVINDSVSYYPSLDSWPRPRGGGGQAPTNPRGHQHWDTTDSPPAASLRASKVLTAFQPSVSAPTSPSVTPRRLGGPQGFQLAGSMSAPTSPSVTPRRLGDPQGAVLKAIAIATGQGLPGVLQNKRQLNQLPHKLQISPLANQTRQASAEKSNCTQPPVQRPENPVVGMGKNWKETGSGLRRPRPKVTAAPEPVLAGSMSAPMRARRLGDPSVAGGSSAPTAARGRLPLPSMRRLSTGVRNEI